MHPSGSEPPTRSDRLAIYLGGLRDAVRTEYPLDEAVKGVISTPGMTYGDFLSLAALCAFGRKWLAEWSLAVRLPAYQGYVHPVKTWLAELGLDLPFVVYPLDNLKGFATPTFVKSRRISERPSNALMLPLCRERHWSAVRLVDRFDRRFEDKEDRLVWRGATTGVFKPAKSSHRHSSRYFVAGLGIRGEAIDVGYDKIIQLPADMPQDDLEAIGARVLGPMSMPEQLSCKYLLSLEGNDVASGLKWMLYSNSAVIMPAPTCESWACEGLLQPFVHYVPVDHDLSNLEEVVDWCRAHDAECRAIAENGRAFIAAFLDERSEAGLVNAVVRAFAEKVVFTPSPAIAPFLRDSRAVRAEP
jgi:hypothetical protein